MMVCDGVTVAEDLIATDFDYAGDIAILKPDEQSTQLLLDKICKNAEKVGLF